jgi:omega-6 fatty acid desaturase (delta-12 desaturase)
MEKIDHTLEDAPLWTLIKIIIRQTLGWPLYLMYNVSGQYRYAAFTNHFIPTSPLFEKKHYWQVVISDIGLAIMCGLLYLWAQQRGAGEVWMVYGIPYLLVNHWIVAITYLQHTSPISPHYRDGSWNFQRGALSTVDRSLLGWVGAWTTHGISETHVAHHVSSKIPHYNAWEATDALREFLGPHYIKIEDNVFVSLWRTLTSCQFIEDEGGVIFYKNRKGEAQMEGRFVPRKEDEVSDSGFEEGPAVLPQRPADD